MGKGRRCVIPAVTFLVTAILLISGCVRLGLDWKETQLRGSLLASAALWIGHSPPPSPSSSISDRLLLPAESSVSRFLKRDPLGLDLAEWKRVISQEDFERRRHAFYNETRGILNLEESQKLGFCPPLESRSNKQSAAERRGLIIRADKELGYNLEGLVPYSYYLHLHGCLNETHSYPGASPFFFFDMYHRPFRRSIKGGGEDDEGTKLHIYDFKTWDSSWNPFMKLWYSKPESDRKKYWNPLRTNQYPSAGLEWPPFHSFYSNQMFGTKRRRPIAIVAGKHNKQWAADRPVNTFAEPHDLSQIMEPLVHNGYLVIYNRVRKKLAGDADYRIGEDPGDYTYIHQALKDFNVITFEDLWATTCQAFNITTNDLTTMNLLQLAVYSQASLFIDTQGGGSVISSLFPGDHLILHREGHEKIHDDTSLAGSWAYHNWWRHGGGRFYVFNTVEALASQLQVIVHHQRAQKINTQ